MRFGIISGIPHAIGKSGVAAQAGYSPRSVQRNACSGAFVIGDGPYSGRWAIAVRNPPVLTRQRTVEVPPGVYSIPPGVSTVEAEGGRVTTILVEGFSSLPVRITLS